MDEAGWPVYEEGWHIDGYFDEHTLNFVKGAKGKGKGNFQGACFNCWKNGHRAAECKNPPTSANGAYSKGTGKDGKGKGKGGGACWTCLKTGHQAKNCPEGQAKGKGKGYGSYGKSSGGWGQSVRAISTVSTIESKTDVEGFTEVRQSKAQCRIRPRRDRRSWT